MPFEPPKEEQEDWMINDDTLEKQVYALNEYFINFFKGASLGVGAIPFGADNSNHVCQICKSTNHIATMCPCIGNMKLKCANCGLPHKMELCGMRRGYYSSVGHTKNMC